MAELGFTEAHEMFRREIRNFAVKELAPTSKTRLKADRLPDDVIGKLRGMGLLSMNMPPQYGGQPADWVSVGIAIEELSRVETAAGLFLLPFQIFAHILKSASEPMRGRYMKGMISGNIVPCYGITEPDAGSDIASIKTRAVRDGKNYRLTGEKTSISWGRNGNLFVVFAKTDSQAGAHGVSAFLVPADAKGLSISFFEDTGCKPLGRCAITLDEVAVPESSRLGEEGKGFNIAMGIVDFGRIGLALAALGTAQACLQQAIDYSKRRIQFNRPIAQFEGVSYLIAEDTTHISAARGLCYNALMMRDRGERHTKESAMCKYWCPELAMRVIHNAIIIHGHVGYSEEHTLEQRWRDCLGIEFADGTANIQKIIIAREVIGREAVPY